MIDRLRQLAIFAKAIDQGSFRAAARELQLSPSVVSHHISSLEQHLGVALMYRTTRKLSLTREGQRLLTATNNMLDAIEGELQDLSAEASHPSGELRITLPAVLSHSAILDSMAAFQRTYPRVRLKLDFSDSRRRIVEDGFDIAIRMGLDAKNATTRKKLLQTRRRLVAAPSFLSNQPAIDEPHQLKTWDWLELSPVRHYATTFRKSGEKQVVKPTAVKMSCNDAHALYGFARAGGGLALVPEFLATDDLENGRIEYVLPDWELAPIEIFAEWPPNAPKHGLTMLLVEYLDTTIKNPKTHQDGFLAE